MNIWEFLDRNMADIVVCVIVVSVMAAGVLFAVFGK